MVCGSQLELTRTYAKFYRKVLSQTPLKSDQRLAPRFEIYEFTERNLRLLESLTYRSSANEPSEKCHVRCYSQFPIILYSPPTLKQEEKETHLVKLMTGLEKDGHPAVY